jgi:hypothetical protein
MNTRKNKRKSKSRLRRRRRHINRTRKLKGGGLVNNLSQLLRCATAPFSQCMVVLDKAEKLPSSLSDLMSCVDKGSQLLNYCKSIQIDHIPELNPTFEDCKSKLDKMIGLVKENSIIADFTTLWETPNITGEEPLFQKYSGIYTKLVSSMPLSKIASKDNIIIWADWWRSKLEYMITDLTIVLTQIIGIHVGLGSAPAASSAAPNALSAAPAPLSSMRATKRL